MINLNAINKAIETLIHDPKGFQQVINYDELKIKLNSLRNIVEEQPVVQDIKKIVENYYR